MTNKEAAFILSDKTKKMLYKQSTDCMIPDSLDYKSPIELVMGDIQTQIDNNIVKVVQSYGFNVDKTELEKALKYDRDQYDKGYADARMMYERPQGKWNPTGTTNGYWAREYQCSICGALNHWCNYCPHCGAHMTTVEQT